MSSKVEDPSGAEGGIEGAAEGGAGEPHGNEPPARRRRRAARRVLVGLGLVVVLFLGDQGLRIWVAGRLERGLAKFCGGDRAAEASISAVPFLPRLLFSTLPELYVRIEDVEGQGYSFSSFEGKLRGVEVNRTDLLTGKIDVRDVRSGRLELEAASGGDLGLEHVGVVFARGRATARLHTAFGSLPLEGPYELEERTLTFRSEQRGVLANTIVFEFPEKPGECVTGTRGGAPERG